MKRVRSMGNLGERSTALHFPRDSRGTPVDQPPTVARKGRVPARREQETARYCRPCTRMSVTGTDSVVTLSSFERPRCRLSNASRSLAHRSGQDRRDVRPGADVVGHRSASDHRTHACAGRRRRSHSTLTHGPALRGAPRRAQLAVIPGASHMVLMEQPDLVNALINSFLVQTGPPAQLMAR